MGPFAQLFGSDCKGNWEKTKKGNINVSSLADAKIQHFIAFCKHDGRNVDKKRWVSVGIRNLADGVGEVLLEY